MIIDTEVSAKINYIFKTALYTGFKIVFLIFILVAYYKEYFIYVSLSQRKNVGKFTTEVKSC